MLFKKSQQFLQIASYWLVWKMLKESQVKFLQIAAVAPNNGTEPSTGPASTAPPATTAAPEPGCGNKRNTYHHFSCGFEENKQPVYGSQFKFSSARLLLHWVYFSNPHPVFQHILQHSSILVYRLLWNFFHKNEANLPFSPGELSMPCQIRS